MTTSTIGSSESAAHTSSSDSIALWNPSVAAVWSFLLTPALGPYLHMRNWEQLGRPEKARESRTWFLTIVAMHLLSFVVLAVADAMHYDLEFPAGVWQGVCGAWFLLSGYPQVKHVGTTHGSAYVRRPWAVPLLVTFGIVGALLFASIMVLAMVSP